MKKQMYLKIWSSLCSISLKLVLIIISFAEAVYLMRSKAPRDGLEMIWLLPFVFGVCVCVFHKIINYHKGGVGLKVYYVIVVVRYLVQPYLIQLTNGEVSTNRMSELSASSYQMSIFIMCMELILACVTIQYCYSSFVKKETKKTVKKTFDKIYLGGWIVIIVFVIVLLVRINLWLPALKILGIKENTIDTPIILEATILYCLKAFAFAVFLSKTLKCKIGTKSYYLYFLLTVVLGIFNFITYFGSNRSFIVETALVTIALLYYEFPRYRSATLAVTVPIAIIIICSMFVTKQFGPENVSTSSNSTVSLQYISNQIEEYTNGPWCVGQTFQVSKGLSIQQSFQALSKELTDAFTVISVIPGFKWIPNLTRGMLSSSEVMKYSFETYDRGQMISFSGDFFITFNFLGWFIFPIANIVAIRLLTRLEVKSKSTNNIYYKYMYLWMACLFGLTHCYCIQTLIYCWAKFILFYFIILKVNNHIK